MRRCPALYPALLVAAALLISGPPLAQAAPAGNTPDPPPGQFTAQAQSWPTARQGWILGSEPCGDGECASVRHSADGGDTWAVRGRVPAPVSSPGEAGVGELQFNRLGVGFAFGPDVYSTHDGGRRWTAEKLPGNGRQVLSLALSRGLAQMVVSPCGTDTPDYECSQPSTLWWAPTAPMLLGLRPHWIRAGVRLPASYNISLDADAATSYLTVRREYPAPDELYASTNGVTWSTRPVPCDKNGGNATLADVAPSSPRNVALLCLGDAGFGEATKAVHRSGDTARTTESAGEAPRYGIESALAQSPSGTLLVASTGIESVLYRNADTGTWTVPFESHMDGPGWNDPVFTTGSTGYVIEGNASRGSGVPGTVLATHDGGAHWDPLDVSVPAAD